MKLGEEGGQLPPPDEQLLVGDTGVVSHASDGARVDQRIANYTCTMKALKYLLAHVYCFVICFTEVKHVWNDGLETGP